jgi:hypothetical protein
VRDHDCFNLFGALALLRSLSAHGPTLCRRCRAGHARLPVGHGHEKVVSVRGRTVLVCVSALLASACGTPADRASHGTREPPADRHALSPAKSNLRFGAGTVPATSPTSLLASKPSSASSAFFVQEQDNNLTVWSGHSRVLELASGHQARFRASTDDEQWIGTELVPVNLCWSADLHPECEVESLTWSTAPDGYELLLGARKPTLGAARVETQLEARASSAGLVYTIRSEIELPEEALAAPWAIETVDLWFGGIFWPERENVSKELYSQFVFHSVEGLRSAPKLHSFPVWRDAPYETLQQPASVGFALSFLDHEAHGYSMRLQQASAPSAVGICWWTWDPHWFLLVDGTSSKLSYELVIEPVPIENQRGLLAAARAIDLTSIEEYAVPVFELGQLNDFSTRVSHGSQWGWEPHSRACTLDDQIGRSDASSVAIELLGAERTAWYSRALGLNYFDHEPLRGWFRVEGWVRTSSLSGQARIGVVAAPGPETSLYEEASPNWWWSASVNGTTEWSHVSVDFQAIDDRPVKIVLEQEGSGRSWFDDVSVKAKD